MKIGSVLRAISALVVAGSAAPAFAWDWNIAVHVTSIEVSFVPNSVLFKIDQAAGSCPAGSVLRWVPESTSIVEKAANANAVLSALMMAQESQRQVGLFGVNANCQVQFIWKM